MDFIAKFDFPKLKERCLFFNSQVDQESIGNLTQDIIGINEQDEYLKKYYEIHNLIYVPKPIQIYIDSYGGEIYSCFGLLSIIKTSKTPVWTIATGTAMSCGFLILISGHKRFAYSLSTVMLHQAASGFHGKVRDMEDDLIETKRLQSKIEDIIMEKTKITRAKLDKIYKQKIDWYLTLDDMIKFGVIDEPIN